MSVCRGRTAGINLQSEFKDHRVILTCLKARESKASFQRSSLASFLLHPSFLFLARVYVIKSRSQFNIHNIWQFEGYSSVLEDNRL
jgi:hypothetical protein